MAVRRLATFACAAALAAAGMTTTAGAARADTAASPDATVTDQVATVRSLLGAASPSEAATSAAAQASTQFSEIGESAIDPSSYICDPNTPLRQWLAAKAGPADLMQALSDYDVLNFPEYWSIFYETDATPQSLGPNGEVTGAITEEVDGLKKFWDFDGSAIQTVGMHGSVLDDPAKMAQLVQLDYGVDQATAEQVGAIFTSWVDQMPGGADNPYFSFNAFAFDGTSLGLPTKVIVGDGIVRVFDDLGLQPYALEQVIGHEYGHQVQYHDGLTATTLTGPEQSRRLELMADAFGAYYLTHVKGENLNAKRLVAAVESAYEVGDCSYTSSQHHGTPLQREHSVEWAIGLTQGARPQSTILSGRSFGAKFDAVLPTLVAPDAS